MRTSSAERSTDRSSAYSGLTTPARSSGALWLWGKPASVNSIGVRPIDTYGAEAHNTAVPI